MSAGSKDRGVAPVEIILDRKNAERRRCRKLDWGTGLDLASGGMAGEAAQGQGRAGLSLGLGWGDKARPVLWAATTVVLLLVRACGLELCVRAFARAVWLLLQ